jgi:lipopolysaccharide transport system ATP-binding protein
MDLEIRRGESVGIVGLNGAGKSTLLQLASGVLQPTQGQIQIGGRVAALLELGSGFNPEATGLENVYLYAATLGLARNAIDDRLQGIIDFSGLSDFMDAPVKTYSSGMQVRLAFSVATSVDPDLLIIDEALSVGDGVFAKKSFDRIMGLRERGTALLLSSHALFHVDLFCGRTLWLQQGRVKAFGDTGRVLPEYQAFLDRQSLPPESHSAQSKPVVEAESEGDAARGAPAEFTAAAAEHARLVRATVRVNGQIGQELHMESRHGVLDVEFEIQASEHEPAPRPAVVLSSESGFILGSTLAPENSFVGSPGDWSGRVSFQWRMPELNRGRYRLGVYLLCAQGRYVYAWSDPHVHLNVLHTGPHQGAWLLGGEWSGGPNRGEGGKDRSGRSGVAP